MAKLFAERGVTVYKRGLDQMGDVAQLAKAISEDPSRTKAVREAAKNAGDALAGLRALLMCEEPATTDEVVPPATEAKETTEDAKRAG